MATTHIGANNALVEKGWRPGLCHEAERQAHMMSFVGKGEDSAVVLLDDLSKKRGDVVQVRFSPTDDTHDGFGEGETIRGNEQKVEFHSDELRINWLGEAYAMDSQMTQQRVSFDIKKTTFVKLTAWWARRWEETILNQLSAYTPKSTGTFKRVGHNAVAAVDANHHLLASGVADYTTDEAVAADDTAVMSLEFINQMVLRSMSKSYLTYPIAPCNDGYYHLVMHPEQWLQLRENTTTGDWQDLTRAQLEGGEKWAKSAFARGFLGIWNNVKMHVSDYVPQGVLSTDPTVAQANVRRAVFLGGRSAHMAFGEGYASGGHLDWTEQVDDYRRWGVLADSVFGMKRTIFNGETYANFVCSTYTPT